MVRTALNRVRGKEIKTLGDGFLATFDSTTRAVRAALEMVNGAKGIGLDVRAGVHLGEVEIRHDDIMGIAVNIAKRICDMAGDGEVLVSDTVRGMLVGSNLKVQDKGTHSLKGVAGEWSLYTVEG